MVCSPPFLSFPHSFPLCRNSAELCRRHHLWSKGSMCHAISGARQAAHHYFSHHPMPGTWHYLHVSSTYLNDSLPESLRSLLTPASHYYWSSFRDFASDFIFSLSSYISIGIMKKLLEEVLSSKGLQYTEDMYKRIVVTQGRIEYMLKARAMLKRKKEVI